MTPIEQMLRRAAAQTDWPATPDLAGEVQTRIEGVTPLDLGYRPPIRLRRPLVIALASLLVLAGGAAAIPGIREPVLDWLGLRSVHIERVPRPLPLPARPGASLALGKRVTLAEARRRLGFTPLLPSGLGTPTVYYDEFVPGGGLGLVYPGGKLFLVEVQGKLKREYFFKFVTPATKLERLTIDGRRAIWIHGGLDQFAYADASGAIRPQTLRTAGKVLLWLRGPLLLRLEGAGSKTEALRIARSLRAAP